MKKRVVVVCPGRGSYTKENLKSLVDRPLIQNDLRNVDAWREALGYESISSMDNAAAFKTSLHTKGEHASPLIYMCAKADFLEINRDEFEIVAITGNSMGWYLALAFAGALSAADSFQLIQTMGSMMAKELIGGQIIYPIIDTTWNIDRQQEKMVLDLMKEVNAKAGYQIYISIQLGGYLILAGNEVGLSEMMARLPKIENYPFQLVNHAAFHTPLLEEISDRAFQTLTGLQFTKPQIPLIDGRGYIWQPHSTDPFAMLRYTLGYQVVETYDFTRAITVALKEFAPDHLVLLGPANSLGGALGQILIKNQWRGIQNKADFTAYQKQHPFLVSMGQTEQKSLVTHAKI